VEDMLAKDNEVYRTAVESMRHLESLLFDRLNYFLAGSAFLVTAYAALAVSIKHWSPFNPILLLTYLVNATGFYLSIFFAVINYLNSRIIGTIQQAIIDIESGKINETQYTKTNIQLAYGNYFRYQSSIGKTVYKDDFNNKTINVLLGPLKGLQTYFSKPMRIDNMNVKYHKDIEAPHTYILPLGLSFFWFVAFLVVLPHHFWWAVLGLLIYCAPLLVSFVWTACKNNTETLDKSTQPPENL
jgi:hypothetical protein